MIWFDEPWFTLFQTNGHIRLRREASEVMCLQSAYSTSPEAVLGAGVAPVGLGRFSNSSSQMAQAYSKMIISLLWKGGSMAQGIIFTHGFATESKS